jgi:hypothetical protein
MLERQYYSNYICVRRDTLNQAGTFRANHGYLGTFTGIYIYK